MRSIRSDSNGEIAASRRVKLNPGGIGKGYALDRVAGRLVTSGLQDFLIHGGRSSVLARGNRYDGASEPDGWWIALAHPLRWEEKLGRVRLKNQALGTSGAGKQFFHYEGVRYSHVIDPRTGWPAQGVLSATAICRSGTLADATGHSLYGHGRGSDSRLLCRNIRCSPRSRGQHHPRRQQTGD